MAFRRDHGKSDIESILNNILKLAELEVVAARGKACDIVYTNTKAGYRLGSDASVKSCKSVLAKSIPGICDYCPNGGKTRGKGGEPFEIKDINGKTFKTECSTVDWSDGKPAAVIILRDITEELEVGRHLYALAYSDHLTGIPNRQKLKEDFRAIEEKIITGELSGMLAMFDIDHFKEVNDTYGHNTGDLVLRRLTEYLTNEDAYTEHLYRLGGDEFVYYYAEENAGYESDEEMLDKYEGMLSAMLRTYTLPNIEVKCTLSIGVSLFPRHGENLSEMLRKADIAMYKAKSDGRNRIVFFESQYDIAQKFKDIFINIQPILYGAGKTFGYELVEYGQTGFDDEETVNMSEFNRTVEALGVQDLENSSLYFIDYSKQLLNPVVISNLPKDKFVIQIPLKDEMTEKELEYSMQICRILRDNGYKLALKGLHSGLYSPELMGLADYCKFSASDKNTMRRKRIVATNLRVRFIATNIDTLEAEQAAKNMGYQLFQGFFFSSQPIVPQKTKELSPLKANYFRLLQLTSTDGYLDFHEISAVISSDVALSYKLLKILNSAAVGLRNVSSISAAVAYLGEESLKKWIAVLALRGVAEEKPLELVRMSLIRARFGELLAPQFRIKRNAKQVFLVGMLSLLHIALEKTKEELIEEINVADEVRDSLLTKNGIYSDLLRFFEYYEYANWDAVSAFVEKNQLDPQFVNDSFISAVKWYNDLVAG